MSHSSISEISTSKASGYLQQLCKHFGHKTKVDFETNNGRIEFGFGYVNLTAGQGALTLNATAKNADDLERLKRVLSSHLERFAFREDLQIEWN